VRSRRNPVAVGCVAAAVLSIGCSRKPVTVELSTVEAPWRAELIGVSEPKQVVARRPGSPLAAGAPDIPIPRDAQSGRKWVVVKLKVTAPPPQRPSDGLSGLPLKSFRLEAAGGPFECIAVGSSGEWKDQSGKAWPEFVRPTAGSVKLRDAAGRNRLLLDSGGLYFYSSEPEGVELLFEVPKDAVALRLKV
jgi:hypothetical protein